MAPHAGVIPPPITQDWVFYITAAIIIVTALGVLLIRNVIHAALVLGTCFFTIAALYILLHAQFLAVAQVLVYVGDVTVLILFALMLTRGLSQAHVLEMWGAPAAAGVLVAIGIAALLIAFLAAGGAVQYMTPTSPGPALQSLGSYGIVREFSREMLTSLLLPFEVASGILLMALVGAIVIAREDRQG